MGKARFPGPHSSDVIAMQKKFYAKTTVSSKFVVETGKGAVVTNAEGLQALDLHCDAGVNTLGHCHPKIVQAICDQAHRAIFTEFHNAPHRLGAALAKELALKSPVKKPAKVFFCNSGAEGNEAARSSLRAYRYFKTKEPGRTKAIYFKNSFAGRTKGAKAGSTSKPEVQSHPFMDHCDIENSIYMTFPQNPADSILAKEELDQIDKLHGLENIDRLLIELPCQGEGGIIPVDGSSLKYIYERTQEAGILFISDSVQTGMGRVGPLFGCDVFSWLKPDILVLGKALGGGIPNGAIIFNKNLDWAEEGLHSNTFGGGQLFAAASLAYIAELERVLASGACKKIEKILDSGLRAFLRYDIVTDIRGMGAMWAVEFKNAAIRDKVVKMAESAALNEEYGLRLLGAGRKAVRIMPPLVISFSELCYAVELLERIIESLA